jgi:hypothetical protein
MSLDIVTSREMRFRGEKHETKMTPSSDRCW